MRRAIMPVNDANIDEVKVSGAMDAMRAQHNDDVFAAGLDIGRIEAMDFFVTVANSAILEIFENVKKSKAWQFLRNPESATGNNFASLDEFCRVKLGKSYARMQHLSGNKNVLGQQAFEQAERLGLHQRDYNAIKSLPAPEREIIRQAVEEAKSRDEVLDLLQELAVRNAEEIKKVEKKLTDTEGELKATNQRLEVVRKQREDAEAAATIIKTAPPEEFIDRLQKESAAAVGDALGAVRGRVRAALVTIQQAPDHPAKDVLMASLVGQLQAELNALRNEFNLPDVSSAADQSLAAEVAEWAK